MDEAKRQLVQAWLIKARNDLETAQQIAAIPEGHLDAAVYHCQQAAEKAVKGFLAFHDHRLERTHDVERLVSLASGYDSAYSSWIDVGITLTPFATAYRYPGEAATLEPSRDEFEEALRCARDFLQHVLSSIPVDLRPN
jgi:HEPN domain-containing protein